ncbi:RidA family protein [Desulfoluna butyratoxydans]|uniref:Endoribonuclease l-psp n=1 Tax=Desulfoluna butyratoxydans TaxID=231438 RepID=A0A4U8YKV5_9BACT|nr:Rid family detoxifying hydrolase [Desulfoluna butyratoxydans]VFQ44147.1 endoribonuclease l-psp [Desulfoluna butyratoxydans]
MDTITTDNALKPAGHYSQAIVHNDMIYTSGQLAFDAETGEKRKATIEEETLQVLTNLELVLKEAGSSKDKVLKTTIYISDIALWDQVNRVYAEFFGDHKPARSVVPTHGELHFGFHVELEAVAAV